MDPIFLSEEEVHVIHLDQLERYGGSAGLRDAGLLRSALSQPSASFGGKWLHSDLYEMASAYLFSLAMNHPFIDGNKRVGGMAALAFLEINGVFIDVDADAYADLVLAVAAGKASRDPRPQPSTRRRLSASVPQPLEELFQSDFRRSIGRREAHAIGADRGYCVELT
ncbi:MAG: type II toxin-antitoxin system death-on-curing family toxin [Planctomycetes bacterium]|nr:type II toxin-antitoxin system death-on-curing family toxin [Planctomycetota bacterium]